MSIPRILQSAAGSSSAAAPRGPARSGRAAARSTARIGNASSSASYPGTRTAGNVGSGRLSPTSRSPARSSRAPAPGGGRPRRQCRPGLSGRARRAGRLSGRACGCRRASTSRRPSPPRRPLRTQMRGELMTDGLGGRRAVRPRDSPARPGGRPLARRRLPARPDRRPRGGVPG